MKEKLRSFMAGRYGVDQFGRFILAVSFVLIFISVFFRSFLLEILVLASLGYCYFRILSKNCQKRYEENIIFLSKRTKFLYFWTKQKDLFKQRKTHHIYKCPSCGQKIRIPRNKGKICITCPKCGTDFVKKS